MDFSLMVNAPFCYCHLAQLLFFFRNRALSLVAPFLLFCLSSSYQADLVVKLAECGVAESTLMARLRRVLFCHLVDQVQGLQHTLDNLV